VPPLELIRTRTGVVLLESTRLRALRVPHAFTTRLGGVSAAPFDTLNLAGSGSTGGIDVEEDRLENHRRTLEAVGAPTHRWLGLHLVHGIDVVTCGEPPPLADDGPKPLDPAAQGDALCTRIPGWMLKVTTADCVAILMACPTTGAVAVLHAGWRGVVGGIVRRTVEELRRGGSPPAALVAAIGPCIGLEAFEVGDDVAARFIAAGLGLHVHRRPEWVRPHVDLFGAVATQLAQAGIRSEAIDGSPLCTFCRPDLFFSHRRDAGRTGRMAALVAVREQPVANSAR
jgi:hypothetical protein